MDYIKSKEEFDKYTEYLVDEKVKTVLKDLVAITDGEAIYKSGLEAHWDKLDEQTKEAIYKAFGMVRQGEREACARLAESIYDEKKDSRPLGWAIVRLARTIRSGEVVN
jgi:TRAP-type C4-dicarboxylate transport system substrate-binding protein